MNDNIYKKVKINKVKIFQNKTKKWKLQNEEGRAGSLRTDSLLSASYNFTKINPNWGRRGPATPRLVICGIWAQREGIVLGLAGLLGGWTGHASAPSQTMQEWVGLLGVWAPVDLEQVQSKRPCWLWGSQEGGQRENNGRWSPLHVVTTPSNDKVSTSSAQLKM